MEDELIGRAYVNWFMSVQANFVDSNDVVINLPTERLLDLMRYAPLNPPGGVFHWAMDELEYRGVFEDMPDD